MMVRGSSSCTVETSRFRWKVYYGDGTTVCDLDCSTDRVPALDVQVVLQYDPVAGWYLQSHGDYYVYREGDGLWQACDNMGLWDYLQRPGWKRVLFGRTIRSDDFHDIFQRAISDRNALRGL